jgi:FKBP-type peptidyl-prolyl cis-trans isomerase FkpA
MNRAVSVIVLAALTVTACGSSNNNNSPTSPSSPPVNVPFSTTDLRVGTGADAVNGRTLTVNYTGWLYSTSAADNKGTQFDSSLSPGRTPFSFVLGTGNVIQGWHQGILGMKVGGLRRMVLPPNLAYGVQGRPPEIPGNSTLIFEVELLGVQ